MTTEGKKFYVNNNVGTIKYAVSFHNGIDTHKDGSPFYGIKTFRNKKKMNLFLKGIEKEGYKYKYS